MSTVIVFHHQEYAPWTKPDYGMVLSFPELMSTQKPWILGLFQKAIIAEILASLLFLRMIVYTPISSPHSPQKSRKINGNKVVIQKKVSGMGLEQMIEWSNDFSKKI